MRSGDFKSGFAISSGISLPFELLEAIRISCGAGMNADDGMRDCVARVSGFGDEMKADDSIRD